MHAKLGKLVTLGAIPRRVGNTQHAQARLDSVTEICSGEVTATCQPEGCHQFRPAHVALDCSEEWFNMRGHMWGDLGAGADTMKSSCCRRLRMCFA